MNRPTSTLVLLTLAVMATRTASAQSRDERAIRAAGAAWQRYVATQQVDSIVGMHTSDAMVLFGNSPVMRGSVAIRSGWADIVKLPGLTMRWAPSRIDVTSKTRATEYGTYADSYDTPTGKESDAGTYVTVWHKVNGKWKVALDAPVSSQPPPVAAPAEATEFVSRNGGTLAWSDFAPPGLAPGAKISVLHGDPSKTGRFVLRLSFPDGYEIPLHWHPTAEYVTVLSGGASFGMGNAVNAAATQSYAPGDFVFIPAGHAHWLTARGPTVVQVSGSGPFQMNLGVPR